MLKSISFDLGASSGKVYTSFFDGEKINVEKIHSFKNETFDLGGNFYWDIIYIFNELKKGIKKALNKQNDISSFGLCSFSNDFAFLNKKNELISQVRSYRDKRTMKNENKIYNLLSKKQLYKITGNQSAPFNTFMQIASMRVDELNDELKSANKILFIPDLINYFLCGEMITEKTIASVSQMYDQKKNDFSTEIFKKLKIKKNIFPPMENAGKILGKINKNLFSSKYNIDICICPHHDTASAFIGSLIDENCLNISSGTWAIVGTERKMPIINEYAFKNNIANEGGIKGYHRLLLNTMGNFPMQEILKRKTFVFDFEKAYKNISKTNLGFIDINKKAFYTPENMEEKIAKEYYKKYKRNLKNIDEYYSLISRSLVKKYKDAKEKLEKLINKKFDKINIVGGGSKDKLTVKYIKEEFNLPVFLGHENATIYGNIIFQLIAKNELKNIDEGRELIKRSLVKNI
ncbi:MAG: hypothetical protein LBD41_01880 [Clostridiales Family XIII bacterium]|jgi:rhamnulokinase/L-fuculokinase|nr:hypothetical protein [Clostridiales Family XIII bacterium]